MVLSPELGAQGSPGHTSLELNVGKQCFKTELLLLFKYKESSQVALVTKNPPANAGDVRDPGSIPGSGISPGEGNGNPLQYSCMENHMDRGAW